MLKIAIPNKGALSEDTILLLKEAGYKCRKIGRELVIRDNTNDIDFYFLRPRDIAIYVSNGILDMGITGRDLLVDSLSKATELFALNFGSSSFYYAVPADSSLKHADFNGKRIATSYPNIVALDLQKRGISCEIIPLDGAVEISIQLGVADIIADVVESGLTLKDAGLVTIGDPVLKSEAIVIARKADIIQQKDVRVFLDRVRGIVMAREYVMVEYDIPDSLLAKVCSITPGIESPTISPLSEKGWVAVKSMTPKKQVNEKIDQLAELGAKGIIVTEIKTCRI